MQNADKKEKALYKGLSKQPVTFQHVEEFLVGTGKKKPVKIELKSEHNSFYDIRESVRESFTIQKNGWGHLRLDVEAKGDFLEVSRHVVTDEDFIGSYYQVEYVIHRDQLKKGRQFGEITVKSPYQQLTYQITASMEPKVQLKTEIHAKQYKLELMRDLLEHLCGRLDGKTWIGSSRFIINQLKEEGCDYPEYQMYEAYALSCRGRRQYRHRKSLKDFSIITSCKRESRTGRSCICTFARLPGCTGIESRQCADVCIVSLCRRRIASCCSKLWMEMNPEDKGFSIHELVFMMEELI